MRDIITASGNRQWQSSDRRLKLIIDMEAYSYLRACVEAVSGEITLFGCCDFDYGSHAFKVSRFLMPQQSCTGSSTTVSEKALAALLAEAVEEGLDVSTLRVWAHSHGRMNAYLSAEDRRTIERSFPQLDYLISLVLNHDGHMTAQLTQYRPFPIAFEQLPVTVGVLEEIRAHAQEDVQRKVRQGRDQSYSPDAGGHYSRAVAAWPSRSGRRRQRVSGRGRQNRRWV
jgi:hypothetical protein